MGDDLVSQHLRWMKAAGRSPKTIESRRSVLDQFTATLDGRPATDATEDDCIAFLVNDNWTLGTRRTYHANLSAFYAWCGDRELVAKNPTRNIPKARQLRRPPRPVPDRDFNQAVTQATPRTATWLLLARYMGMRAVEIANLRPEHVDLENRRITLHGKGGKVATMRLTPIAHAALTEWLTEHGDTWKVTAGAVSEAGNYALKAVGSESTFHACRHAFAMELYDDHRDIALVQRALRHSSVATTSIYAATRDAQLDAALDHMGEAS